MEASELRYQEHKILLRIATQLNSAVDLNAALQLSIKETVDLLGLKTGWIWLLHNQTNSVFLAASYNLPQHLPNSRKDYQVGVTALKNTFPTNFQVPAILTKLPVVVLKI